MAKTRVTSEHWKIAVEPKGGSGSPIAMGCANSLTITHNRETEEETCLGSEGNAAQYDYGKYTGTISIEGYTFLYTTPDTTTNVGADDFRGWILNKTKISFVAGNTLAGGKAISGDGVITSFEETGSGDDNPSYSVEIAIDGLPAEVTNV